MDTLKPLDLTGWAPPLRAGGCGDGSAASMAEALLSTPHSPRHLDKRNRLSRLLDKLQVQLQRAPLPLNNNHYPTCFMLDTVYYGAPPHEYVQVAQTKHEQDTPLDLSVKSESRSDESPEPPPTQVSLELPPVISVEPPAEGFVCGVCGQIFRLHDRLAKHIASRHRGRTPDGARAYECDVCQRKFARSDMLTRHARLHSGVKPYACSACGQVFSRSDHLATHHRTHTGEKPYRCPACPYAACRRDMITRHMRTHTRRPQPA